MNSFDTFLIWKLNSLWIPNVLILMCCWKVDKGCTDSLLGGNFMWSWYYSLKTCCNIRNLDSFDDIWFLKYATACCLKYNLPIRLWSLFSLVLLKKCKWHGCCSVCILCFRFCLLCGRNNLVRRSVLALSHCSNSTDSLSDVILSSLSFTQIHVFTLLSKRRIPCLHIT